MIKYYKSEPHYYKVDEDSLCCNPILHIRKSSGMCINSVDKRSFYSDFFDKYEQGTIVEIEQDEFEDALATALLSLNIDVLK